MKGWLSYITFATLLTFFDILYFQTALWIQGFSNFLPETYPIVTLDKIIAEISRLDEQLVKYKEAEKKGASKIQKQHLLNTAVILERRINDLKELIGEKQ